MPPELDFFEAFYASPAQHPWMLWGAGLLGLAFALTRPGLGPGMRRYCVALGALSMADAWLSSNHVYGIGGLTGFASSAVPLFFVLAGDLRYLLLVQGGTARGGLALHAVPMLGAVGLTLIVPLFAQALVAVLPEAHAGPRTLFIVYEMAFFALTLGLLRFHPNLRATPWLRSVSRFVLIYYGLWASADALILLAGADVGFAIRVVPNLLYYGGLIGMIGWAASRAARSAPG